MKKNIIILTLSLLIKISFLTGVSSGKEMSGDCPQKRNTASAPSDYISKVNPLRNEPRHIKKGKVLAHMKAKPLACKYCHGISGNGQGSMSQSMNPKPRNFTCTETMNKIPDGQLFWIIKKGSKGTAMPAYSYLSDKKIWQLIHYIRSLSKSMS
jgi:cytochrome c553